MKKKPIRMLFRVLKLFFSEQEVDVLVQKSYDRISGGYDQAWTNHMRDLTAEMIEKLDIQSGQIALDLTCGTGYTTGLIAKKMGVKVIGVDQSGGMLACARQNNPDGCEFIQADILKYLKSAGDGSFDLVTCCWGLGYSKPLSVLRQIRRVLKKGGKVGIIDNTLFSLKEVMYCSILAFMEQPEKLENLMKFRFLTGSGHLKLWFALAGLGPSTVWGGSKSYEVDSGRKAIERLQATGAAAGFEYTAKPEHSEEIFDRFAEILEQKYLAKGKIPIIHRYIGGVAAK